MLVTFYEKNSQNMHRYNAPSYLTGMGSSPMQAVTEGYLTMLADVYFNTGSSHSDMLDCVEAATRKVIEMGYADPKRIGVEARERADIALEERHVGTEAADGDVEGGDPLARQAGKRLLNQR